MIPFWERIQAKLTSILAEENDNAAIEEAPNYAKQVSQLIENTRSKRVGTVLNLLYAKACREYSDLANGEYDAKLEIDARSRVIGLRWALSELRQSIDDEILEKTFES